MSDKPREYYIAKSMKRVLVEADFQDVANPGYKDRCIHVIEKSAFDTAVNERDAYARAMAVALKEGIYNHKELVKAKIEKILKDAGVDL